MTTELVRGRRASVSCPRRSHSSTYLRAGRLVSSTGAQARSSGRPGSASASLVEVAALGAQPADADDQRLQRLRLGAGRLYAQTQPGPVECGARVRDLEQRTFVHAITRLLLLSPAMELEPM